MRIIAVDDEPHAIRNIRRAIEEELPQCDAAYFDNPEDALEYAKGNSIDVAFLDVQMGHMSGLAFARLLLEIHSRLNIIFVTGYSKYALDAHKLHSAGYLLKPVTRADLREALDNLRYPVAEPENNKLRIRAFGNFEVFQNGKPLYFPRSKEKELFAYLISREGAMCSNREIIAAIWEDKEYTESIQSQFRHLVSDLARILESAGAGDVLIRQRGYLAVAPEKISCDYYDLLKGDEKAKDSFRGEFMAQYSWAEVTAGYLTDKTAGGD